MRAIDLLKATKIGTTIELHDGNRTLIDKTTLRLDTIKILESNKETQSKYLNCKVESVSIINQSIGAGWVPVLSIQIKR